MEGADDPNDAPSEASGEASDPESTGSSRGPYVVPRYHAEGEPAWYHVLHGTVPGHQIDFMYCPEVPQGRLTQTHFGHLARLMKYIEPRQGAPYAFALGNLSRDDVQHEPGHGGLALIFALRVAGVTDHAGRAMPPYAHGVVAIDRALDYGALLQAIRGFYRRFLAGGTEAEDATGSFYRAYVRVMQERRETVESFLAEYIRDFDELPQPPRSALRFEWEADEEALPKRVTIVHADDEPFENVAHAAALLGAMLYKSNIKWTTITSGREIEIPGGISIRFVPASEAPRDRQSGGRDAKGLVLSLDDLPAREDELAQQLFGAVSRTVETKVTRAGWREALAASKAEDAAAAVGGAPPRPSNRPPPIPSTPPAQSEVEVSVDVDDAATIPAPLERDPAFDPRRSSSVKGVPSAFDPRRSAPVTGMASAFDQRRSAPVTGMPSAFDPRRSAPMTGMPSAFDPRRSSPVTGIAAASAGAAPAAVGKLASVPPPPSSDVDGPASRDPSVPVSQRAAVDLVKLDEMPAPRSRLGMWIGIVGGLGVVAAIAAAVAGGGGESTSGAAGAGSSTTSAGAGVSPTTNATPSTSPSSSPQETPPAAGSAAPASTESAPVKGASSSAPANTGSPSTARPPGTSTPTSTRPKLRPPLRRPGQ